MTKGSVRRKRVSKSIFDDLPKNGHSKTKKASTRKSKKKVPLTLQEIVKGNAAKIESVLSDIEILDAAIKRLKDPPINKRLRVGGGIITVSPLLEEALEQLRNEKQDRLANFKMDQQYSDVEYKKEASELDEDDED